MLQCLNSSKMDDLVSKRDGYIYHLNHLYVQANSLYMM